MRCPQKDYGVCAPDDVLKFWVLHGFTPTKCLITVLRGCYGQGFRISTYLFHHKTTERMSHKYHLPIQGSIPRILEEKVPCVAKDIVLACIAISPGDPAVITPSQNARVWSIGWQKVCRPIDAWMVC